MNCDRLADVACEAELPPRRRLRPLARLGQDIGIQGGGLLTQAPYCE